MSRRYDAPMLGPLFRTMRPRQWVKNLFVLPPLIFAQSLRDPQLLLQAGIAFAVFCALASSIYLLNDTMDRERDRLHPLKKLRPIASGELSVRTAVLATVILALTSIAGSWWLGLDFLVVALVYLGINLLYSAGGIKKIVILDVMVVAVGYVLRVLAGGMAIDVTVSAWLLLCTIFMALFLAFSKRRHELVLLDTDAAGAREVLGHYSPAFLDQMMNVVTASTVMSYALWATAPETTEKFGEVALVYTVPFVLFGIFRYLYLIYQVRDERNPTESMLSDVPFLLNLALWGLSVLLILYTRAGSSLPGS